MLKVNSETIIYVYPHRSTFIKKDIDLLSEDFLVKECFFDVSSKYLLPFHIFQQLFFLLRFLPKARATYCHFAGYPAFLPVLLSKLFRKPCFVIVAGTDAARFPDFRYGNFVRSLQGKITGISLRFATHILPVHESLFYQDYSYYKGGEPAQGYSFFYPKAKKTPFTPVYYGYDALFFTFDSDTIRLEKSFITVGNLSEGYMFKRKGYDLIIELARNRPEINVTLVGWDGIQELNVPSNVTLVPFMNQKELVKLLNRHQFYFQLSIMEGFPNALAEAMLCGCIPIGSNVSGIPYIIGETGFILSKHSLSELEDLINKVLDKSHNEVKELTLQARLRIKEKFSLKERKNNLVQMYNNYKLKI